MIHVFVDNVDYGTKLFANVEIDLSLRFERQVGKIEAGEVRLELSDLDGSLGKVLGAIKNPDEFHEVKMSSGGTEIFRGFVDLPSVEFIPSEGPGGRESVISFRAIDLLKRISREMEVFTIWDVYDEMRVGLTLAPEQESLAQFVAAGPGRWWLEPFPLFRARLFWLEDFLTFIARTSLRTVRATDIYSPLPKLGRNDLPQKTFVWFNTRDGLNPPGTTTVLQAMVALSQRFNVTWRVNVLNELEIIRRGFASSDAPKRPKIVSLRFGYSHDSYDTIRIRFSLPAIFPGFDQPINDRIFDVDKNVVTR